METKPAPQLFTVEETILVERYRCCCRHHQLAIQLMTEALAERCAATDHLPVAAFIKTQQ